MRSALALICLCRDLSVSGSGCVRFSCVGSGCVEFGSVCLLADDGVWVA